jgi:hypothetical protein
MTFDPNCKHDQGWYLCETPKHPTHWMMWCCAARCGHCQQKHPFTGISYPRNPKPEKKISIDYKSGEL